MRSYWFPLLVLGPLTAWWCFGATTSGNVTAFQLRAILCGGLLVSAWYLARGAARRRARVLVVVISWLVLSGWFAAFRPVFNGELAIYGWRSRFAPAPDRTMPAIVTVAKAIDWKPTARDYPGFLGGGYWPEVPGVRLTTDWKAHPPQEVWRRAIGAGWSGFSIVGTSAITQEQRGDVELVACYSLESGDPIWVRRDETRFDPGNFTGGLGGVGPRATPTIHEDRVLTQTANGHLNCLDVRTGAMLWAHNVRAETESTVVTWGKAGSPLVVDDMVIISAGAPSDAALRENYNSSLVAYDLANGALRWAAGNRQASYASPIIATIGDERQIICVNEGWVSAHRTVDGAVLWEYPWASEADTTPNCTQPIPLASDRMFLSKGYGVGASLLQIERDKKGAVAVRPLWNPPIAPVMKTKFANVVVRDGYVYGLDETLLECIEIETGRVRWKKRRQPEIGHGQILLVGDSILVLSEMGELTLVDANPDEYTERGSIQILNPDNVTWNTLAFSVPYLLVRNAREAACFRLTVSDDTGMAKLPRPPTRTY